MHGSLRRDYDASSQNVTVFLAHYDTLNSDKIPDPLVIFQLNKTTLTPLAIDTGSGFRRVDDEPTFTELISGVRCCSLSDEIASFLNVWLDNLSAQGFLFQNLS